MSTETLPVGRECLAEKTPFSHFIAADDILKATAEKTGLSLPLWNSLAGLRVAHDFLYQATLAFASGSTTSDLEFVEPYRVAVAKIAEFELALPCDVRRSIRPAVLMGSPSRPEGRA